MTRFREEHYATRAWKKASATGTLNQTPSAEVNKRESRAQYHKKPLQARKAIAKAQKAQGRLM